MCRARNRGEETPRLGDRMKPTFLYVCAFAWALTHPGTIMAQDKAEYIPEAVIGNGPSADADYPPLQQIVAIPSHGVAVNGWIYIANGKGPHPTLLLLRGLPGYSGDIDLVQAVRRAGCAEIAGKSAAAPLTAIEKRFVAISSALQGGPPGELSRELAVHQKEWDLEAWSAELIRQPLLVIGASAGNGDTNQRLAKAVSNAGGRVESHFIETDHNFQDRRITLSAFVVHWLQVLI